MTDHKGLPVEGYRPQSEANVQTVNEHKQMEERLLRRCEVVGLLDTDKRWLAIARTHFEEGFMALNRAVFRPGRLVLPEDAQTPAPAITERKTP
jgi:hypothetical protein